MKFDGMFLSIICTTGRTWWRMIEVNILYMTDYYYIVQLYKECKENNTMYIYTKY